MSTSIGGDGDTQHLTNIQVINAALAGRPAGMTVCTHMCRGNFRSSWTAEGGYDHVAEALFGELAVDGFFLEYDDARSGGFEPLRFVPKGEKRVVLGLVTSKRAALESKDDLKRRIDEAAKYVPLDQLCLSSAMRLLVDRRRQRADPGRTIRQAAPRGRDRARSVGLSADLTQVGGLGSPDRFGSLWRPNVPTPKTRLPTVKKSHIAVMRAK